MHLIECGIKLQTYGVTGNLLEWFRSYLSDRKQKVMYKNLLSSRNTINAGVPQEPPLGPLLFLIYVNDVSGKCYQCADFLLMIIPYNIRQITLLKWNVL